MLAILALTRRMADPTTETGIRLDLVGTMLSAIGLGLIVFSILRAGDWGFVKPRPGAPEGSVCRRRSGCCWAAGWFCCCSSAGRTVGSLRAPNRSSTLRSSGIQRCAAASPRSSSSTCCRPGCSSPCPCSSPSRSGSRRSRRASASSRSRSRSCWPPRASQRSSQRVTAPGCANWFSCAVRGIAVMVAALDAGAGPEIVTWPMLLAGLGVGSLASQLGSVTVSSVSDQQSNEWIIAPLQMYRRNRGNREIAPLDIAIDGDRAARHQHPRRNAPAGPRHATPAGPVMTAKVLPAEDSLQFSAGRIRN